MWIISVLCLFVMAEFMVRIMVPKETFWLINNIYRAVETPGVGYTLKPNFVGTAFGVDLKTNSLGFRGAEWNIKKSPNTFRIALIGDSHAFGYGVPYEQSVGEQLSTLLNQQENVHYEVLNFAISAYNSQQELAVLQNYALQYQPDLIIVIVSSNDHDPTPIVDKEGYLYSGVHSSTQLFPVIDESIQKIQSTSVSWLTKNSHLLLYLHLLVKKYQLAQKAQTPRYLTSKGETGQCWLRSFPSGPISARLAKMVYSPLKTMIHEAKQRNIPIIIANFNAFLDYRQLFEKISQEEQIQTLELLALFPETCSWEDLVEQFGLGWNDHLNAVAHRRWAESLVKLIEKQGIINNHKQHLKLQD